MRAFTILVAAVLASIGIGVGALAGLGSTSVGTSPSTKASIAAAAKLACWSNSTKLIASPTSGHPGEIIAVDTTGPNSRLLEGGNFTTFEADTSDGWSVAYYLASPGGTATTYGIIPFASEVAFAGVGTTGVVKVRIPDVPPGTYRVVRFYNSSNQASGMPLFGFPAHGANLCATVTVLATPPALRGSNTIAISVTPSSALHDGERVRVQLRGFGDGGKVWLSECAFADFASPLGCGPELPDQIAVSPSPSGTASTTFVVHSHASATPGDRQRSLDCSTNCVLVATLGSGYADAMADLQFTQPGAATGTFELMGGPAPGVVEQLSGTISFVAASGKKYTTVTAPNGEFSIVLPPGRYTASGRSPKVHVNGHEMVCQASGTITVGSDTSTDVLVSCDVP